MPVGEFLLGHRGEGGEVAPMPKPPLLVHNGTFLVMRKLQQEVVRFRQYLKEEAERMMKVPGCLPDKVAGDVCKVQEYLAAKMMGRWKDGSPVDLYPDAPAGHQTNAFSYHGDEDGARCPLGAHVRRANPRDSLGFCRPNRQSAPDAPPRHHLRRVPARRRLSHLAGGPGRARDHVPLSQCQHRAPVRVHPEAVDEFREEFKQGDDGDPITGTRFGDGHMVGAVGPKRGACDAKGRMVIQGDQRTGRIPYVCSQLPNFVITKGGEYFFMPSMTGLVLLASGKVSTK